MDPLLEERLIDHLLELVTPEKRDRMRENMELRTAHLQVVLEDIFQPHNASAVMRSCECFGIQHLHVVESRYTYTLNREVAMGASNWISLHRYREPDGGNTRRCIEKLKGQGLRIVATSLDPTSVPLDQFPVDSPFSLWFGTEEEGLSAEVMEAAEAHVHIPMRGFTQSFNISVSAALCLYDLRGRIEKSGIDWHLPDREKKEIYRLWLKNSVRNCEVVERNFLKQWAGKEQTILSDKKEPVRPPRRRA